MPIYNSDIAEIFDEIADYLEIAINMGKAATLLGLRLEEMIQIDFK